MSIIDDAYKVLALEGRSEEWSPAPWVVEKYKPHVFGVNNKDGYGVANRLLKVDAELIAHYRNVTPALAREVIRLRKELEKLVERLDSD